MDEDRRAAWGVSVKMEGKWEEAVCADEREAGATLESLQRDYDGEIEDLTITRAPQQDEEPGKTQN